MKILVVDDETDVKLLFEMQFRREVKSGNLEFAFAFSGEEALTLLEEHELSHEHEAILILSDINMPGMSGLELLKQIKQKYKEPPPVVMMITAYGDEENLSTANQYGADAFLTKPVDFVKLKERLKAWEEGLKVE